MFTDTDVFSLVIILIGFKSRFSEVYLIALGLLFSLLFLLLTLLLLAQMFMLDFVIYHYLKIFIVLYGYTVYKQKQLVPRIFVQKATYFFASSCLVLSTIIGIHLYQVLVNHVYGIHLPIDHEHRSDVLDLMAYIHAYGAMIQVLFWILLGIFGLDQWRFFKIRAILFASFCLIPSVIFIIGMAGLP